MSWWQDKLGGTPRPPSPLTPMAPIAGMSTDVSPFRDVHPPSAIPSTPPSSVSDLFNNPNQLLEASKKGATRGLHNGETCPECGSALFFAQGVSVIQTPNGVAHSRAECMSCGYPNTQGSLGVASSTQGPVLPARQGLAPGSADIAGFTF